MRPLAALLVAAVLAGQAGSAAGDPPQCFLDQRSPPPPDYRDAAAWAARPGDPGAAAAVPPNATPAAGNPAVDVFYVHPTTDTSLERWNQPVADATVNRWTDASVVARQASIFNGCCRVIAPRYRQATMLALKTFDGEGAHAYDLAYGDVERAFDHYLREDNHGRPFILAGHSQGAYHVERLLERRIDGTPLQRQLVAAYVVGFNLSVGDFGKSLRHIVPCDTPAQTGCVAVWNAVLPTTDLAKARAAAEARYVRRYGDDPAKTLLCVNPLSFSRSEPAAGREASLGAEPGDPDAGPLRPLAPHSLAARCEQGLLVVDPDPALGLKPLPGGAMHYHDLGLVYADVRANADLRARAFLTTTTNEASAQPGGSKLHSSEPTP